MTSEANYLLEQVQNAMNEIGAISEQSGSVNARLQCAREVIDVLYKNDYIGALIDLGFDEMRALICLEALFCAPNADEVILMVIWWQFNNALDVAHLHADDAIAI